MMRTLLAALLAVLVGRDLHAQSLGIRGVLSEARPATQVMGLDTALARPTQVRAYWRVSLSRPQVVTFTLRTPQVWETELEVGRAVDGQFESLTAPPTSDRVYGAQDVEGLRSTYHFEEAGSYLVAVTASLTPELQRYPVTLEMDPAWAGTDGAHVFPREDTVLAAFDIPEEPAPRHRDWVLTAYAAERMTVTLRPLDESGLHVRIGTVRSGEFQPIPGKRGTRVTFDARPGETYVARVVSAAEETGAAYVLRIDL